MNLSMLLDMAVTADPDRIAVGACNGGLSYRNLAQAAGKIAATLAELGATNVGLVDLNSVAVPALLFGAAAAGIPLAPLNYRLTDAQIDAAVQALEPAVVVVGESTRDRVRARPGVIVIGADELAASATGAAADLAETHVDPEQPAVLLFTSGTTGPPKGAILRHRHLVSYILSSVEFWNAGEDEAILLSVPNYHIAGISSILSSVYSGRRMVQLPAFNAEAWVEAAAAEAVTHAMVVPTMLSRILDVIETRGTALPALRSLSYGGGRMPVEVVRRALDLLPHVGFVNAYGLTETSSTITVLDPAAHREAHTSMDPSVRARLASVGRVLPGVEIEIRSQDGTSLGTGLAGEVFVRGEQVSGEYLTSSALDAEGWYPTRDRGHLDEEGYLFLDGRADDVIVRGGENISPGEVEDVLVEHPDVAEAAVIGVADDAWGERVEAVVVLKPGSRFDEKELREWVRARLRSTKVPSRIHRRVALPYNDTGKLLRRSLRDDIDAAEQVLR